MKKGLVCFALVAVSCTYSLRSEKSRTESFLGVEVNDFPKTQKMPDEVDQNAPVFYFTAVRQTFSGETPKAWHEPKSSVYAKAPDGSIWEAYCGYAGESPKYDPKVNTRADALTRPTFVDSYNGFVSSPYNTRQNYEGHLGYAFNPYDIFIGKREEGRLNTKLFFRDVGSHATAPHHIAIDNSYNVHLVIADVNISDDNHLDLYWVIGSPVTGKWTSAWLIDQRGFTSISHPWNGAWGEKVHLLWSWDTGEHQDPAMGLYHVERTNAGFSRVTRIATGRNDGWSAAVDPKSGRLLVGVSTDDGVYLISKEDGSLWSRQTPFPAKFDYRPYLLIEPGGDGSFLVKLGFDDFLEWRLVPQLP